MPELILYGGKFTIGDGVRWKEAVWIEKRRRKKS